MDEDVDEVMTKLTDLFQEISGTKDKIVLALPITIKLTTSILLGQDQVKKVADIVKDVVKGSEFKFEGIKYVGVTD